MLPQDTLRQANYGLTTGGQTKLTARLSSAQLTGGLKWMVRTLEILSHLLDNQLKEHAPKIKAWNTKHHYCTGIDDK